MRAFVITLSGNEQSEASADRLLESHEKLGNEFDLVVLPATEPGDAVSFLKQHGLEWTYPWVRHETRAGLTLHPYTTTNRLARIATFVSHYRLWKLALLDEVLILEDDAVFTRKFKPHFDRFAVLGINDPRGATRRAAHYHFMVQTHTDEVSEVPWIDKRDTPQGLAGASAYLMRPTGATAALNLASRHGAWPNDALLCKQLMPGMLGTIKKYYTKVQGTPSTLA
jgi:GR25 family glycosyltransferase involved in LPS biosynthesis